MPPHLAALLLQASEATKLVGAAGLEATKAAAHDGNSIPWFLFLLALAAMTLMGIILYREQKTKNADIQKAVEAVRIEAAKEMAVNVAHAQDMSKQLVAQYERQITDLNETILHGQRTLQEANKDLRQTERDSIEVLNATGTKIRELSTAANQLLSNQQQVISNQNQLIMLLNQHLPLSARLIPVSP